MKGQEPLVLSGLLGLALFMISREVEHSVIG